MKTNKQYNLNIQLARENIRLNRPLKLKENQVYDNKGNIHEVDIIDTFYHGIAFVKDSDGCYFINENRKRINDEVYTRASNFKHGYACVEISSIFASKYNYLDLNGFLLFDVWMNSGEFSRLSFDFLNRNFIRVIKYDCNYNVVSSCLLCRSINMQGFSVTRVLGGYRSFKGEEVFYTNDEPVMLYGSRYVLCINKDKEKVYLFDRNNPKDTRLLGKAYNIEFGRNIIIDKFNNRAYLIRDNGLVDITDYYKLYLKHHWDDDKKTDKRPTEVILKELKSIIDDLEKLANIEDGHRELQMFSNPIRK